LVRRKKAERVIVTSLRDRILNPDSIEYVPSKSQGRIRSPEFECSPSDQEQRGRAK
jgi:hypothetical protein